ncbi:bifunctional phosphoserine phosphatase/homoserine phosphotransferase ThrH [Gammaproteobacteria bacterium]|nr:bifunctional phosphoserine phosphatase/homoserine phosphotransferase ThrH [Gammaproteobacteria bacterium]
MKIACLDFEGVLVPEIWVNLAEQTNIKELRVTTRDIANYDELMRFRLDLMAKHGLGYNDLNRAAEKLEPLPGALEFLVWLRSNYQVTIISDTFYELAGPLLSKLDNPMTLCHRLTIGSGGNIIDYKLRQADPKRHCVKAFQSLGYEIVAAGDSYNDISMLEQAENGILFQPSEKVVNDFPDFPVALNYEELKTMFTEAM